MRIMRYDKNINEHFFCLPVSENKEIRTDMANAAKGKEIRFRLFSY